MDVSPQHFREPGWLQRIYGKHTSFAGYVLFVGYSHVTLRKSGPANSLATSILHKYAEYQIAADMQPTALIADISGLVLGHLTMISCQGGACLLPLSTVKSLVVKKMNQNLGRSNSQTKSNQVPSIKTVNPSVNSSNSQPISRSYPPIWEEPQPSFPRLPPVSEVVVGLQDVFLQVLHILEGHWWGVPYRSQDQPGT